MISISILIFSLQRSEILLKVFLFYLPTPSFKPQRDPQRDRPFLLIKMNQPFIELSQIQSPCIYYRLKYFFNFKLDIMPSQLNFTHNQQLTYQDIDFHIVRNQLTLEEMDFSFPFIYQDCIIKYNLPALIQKLMPDRIGDLSIRIQTQTYKEKIQTTLILVHKNMVPIEFVWQYLSNNSLSPHSPHTHHTTHLSILSHQLPTMQQSLSL